VSELLYREHDKIDGLLQFSLGIVRGEDGVQLLRQYQHLFDNLTPRDVVEMEDRQLALGVSIDDVKATIGKVVNVFFQYLRRYPWEPPGPDTFIGTLMAENRELEHRLKQMKDVIRELNRASTDTVTDTDALSRLKKQVQELAVMDRHYLKKENILFPYLEKRWPWPRPLQVMWSIDDDCRNVIRETATMLTTRSISMRELNAGLGRLYFLLHGMIFKEELVLFPLADETCSDEEFRDMLHQSVEIGFAFIPSPPVPKTERKTAPDDSRSDHTGQPVPLGTGSLPLPQLVRLFNTLPVDLTVVDENDEVRFFSNPAHRIFSRSPAIIGRKVQNCHPPESMDRVQALLDAFRSGEKDEDTFWIQLNGRFLVIRYFALRDENGRYTGCLEVSQDVTDIRNLEGEKRL